MTTTLHTSAAVDEAPPWAGLLALAAALTALAALWVPVNLAGAPNWFGSLYFSAPPWWEGLQPRALMATLRAALGLGWTGYNALLQVTITAWLWLALAWVWPRGGGAGPAARWGAALALGLCLALSQPVFWANTAQYTDVMGNLCLMAALWAHAGRRGWPARLGAAALAGLAVLNHEASLLGLAVIWAWLVWRHGPAGALRRAWPAMALALALLAATALAARHTPGFAATDYAAYLADPLGFLWLHSGNVVGLALAGGGLWAVYGAAVWLFVRGERPAGRAWPAAALAAVLTLLSLAGLLVAWDTSRIASLVWLPCVILLRHTGLPALAASSRRGLALLAAVAALHAALPPALTIDRLVFPANHYAQAVLPPGYYGLFAVPGPARLARHNLYQPDWAWLVRGRPPAP